MKKKVFVKDVSTILLSALSLCLIIATVSAQEDSFGIGFYDNFTSEGGTSHDIIAFVNGLFQVNLSFIDGTPILMRCK